jgi:peptide/nickel transport system permease protein
VLPSAPRRRRFSDGSLFALAAWLHGAARAQPPQRARDYAEASAPAIVNAQLLPAARGFLAVELVLLVPALLVAEATVSYLGLGFPDVSASWGTLLQDAANVRMLSEAPWMLAPAAAMFVVVLGTQLLGLARPAESPIVAP